MSKPFLEHLASAAELETTYEAVRAGFVALALEKNRRATAFVAEARALKEAASHARTPHDLLGIEGIQLGLLTAAGVSDKARNHLQDADKREAVVGLINNFLERAGANFVEELVFRFLLIRGDALGGLVRNVGGFIAQCKLTRAIIAHLRLAGKACQWLPTDTTHWAAVPDDNTDIELHLKGLAWEVNGKPRSLRFNLTVPLFANNVDICLFNARPDALTRETYNTPAAYLALGELKGGIDPAGADEHWKTATRALARIHTAFAEHGLQPKTFFVGAAIEAKMAEEIWAMLQMSAITNAANLTRDEQIASITRWLCSL